ncbi:transcriptional regulator [Pseudomonas aeruginosa VRFPA02]|nr:transcriptional regulator [Pseudomonas aeruginosa VRFPA02]
MKIGELAKLTGLATSRIRFYEASGLIRSQRKANGYRDYAADTVWILELVTGAQGAGFSLEEIARLLPSGDGAWQHGELLEGLRRKVAEIEPCNDAWNRTRHNCWWPSKASRTSRTVCSARKTPSACWSACARKALHRRSGVHGKPARGGPLPRRRSSGFPTLDLEVDLNLRVTPTHPDSLPKPAADGITHRGRSTQ